MGTQGMDPRDKDLAELRLCAKLNLWHMHVGKKVDGGFVDIVMVISDEDDG